MNHKSGMTRHGESHTWAFRISAGLLSITALFFLRLPLINSLGYEYAAAIAFVLPLVIGPFVIVALRRSVGDSFQIQFHRILKSVLLLVTIPLLLAVVGTVVVKNCSLWEGCQFYLLIPVVTSVWLMALAFFCYAAVRRAMFLYFIAVTVVFVYALYTGYFSPQIYAYNFIFGFFPGISYDEVLPVQSTLILFRFVTLLAAGLMFLLAEYRWHRGQQNSVPATPPVYRRKKFPIVVILILLLAASWLFRTNLGFETTES